MTQPTNKPHYFVISPETTISLGDRTKIPELLRILGGAVNDRELGASYAELKLGTAYSPGQLIEIAEEMVGNGLIRDVDLQRLNRLLHKSARESPNGAGHAVVLKDLVELAFRYHKGRDIIGWRQERRTALRTLTGVEPGSERDGSLGDILICLDSKLRDFKWEKVRYAKGFDSDRDVFTVEETKDGSEETESVERVNTAVSLDLIARVGKTGELIDEATKRYAENNLALQRFKNETGREVRAGEQDVEARRRAEEVQELRNELSIPILLSRSDLENLLSQNGYQRNSEGRFNILGAYETVSIDGTPSYAIGQLFIQTKTEKVVRSGVEGADGMVAKQTEIQITTEQRNRARELAGKIAEYFMAGIRAYLKNEKNISELVVRRFAPYFVYETQGSTQKTSGSSRTQAFLRDRLRGTTEGADSEPEPTDAEELTQEPPKAGTPRQGTTRVHSLEDLKKYLEE